MSERRKAHAAVLFSGGSDSTLAAAQILDECDRITLLTFDPGYLLFLENTRVHAKKLKEVFGVFGELTATAVRTDSRLDTAGPDRHE